MGQQHLDRLSAVDAAFLHQEGTTTHMHIGGLATFDPTASHAVISHYNIQPVIDIFATPIDRDLGAVANDVSKIIDDMKPELPRGAQVVMLRRVARRRRFKRGAAPAKAPSN